MPGIFRSAISRSYGIQPHPLERGAAVGRDVDVVFGERQRLRQQIADARLVVDDEHARARRAGRRRGGAGAAGAGARRAAARPLAVEPGVDVALAEPPLAADADRRNLAGLDQPVDRAKVDLEVLQDFFGRQKRFVNHVVSVLAGRRRDRQFDGEDRAAVRMVGGDDLPAVLLHDAVGDRQPEPGALADFLRRVERLENPRQRVLRECPSPVSRTVATIRSPAASTAVVTSMRPAAPVAAIACSAFITMFRNTWCSSSGSLCTRGSFSS